MNTKSILGLLLVSTGALTLAYSIVLFASQGRLSVTDERSMTDLPVISTIPIVATLSLLGGILVLLDYPGSPPFIRPIRSKRNNRIRR
jgi:hypothetical protein